jgi:hypothetical protein
MAIENKENMFNYKPSDYCKISNNYYYFVWILLICCNACY